MGWLVRCLVALLVVGAGIAHTAPPDSEGAKTFWAFQPVERPAVPEVKNAAWVRSPLDPFVLSKLEENGLAPAPQADKRTLIRRATFDLTGLPSTPEEVEAFLNDDSPDAFARVVDRLLASPRYGERWGRHWLDVARYADSNGMDENLAYANAWRYRDYVIEAFNNDKPYDQFVREQLAGDLMPVPGNERETIARRVATGFLALGAKMLAEDDPVKMQMDIIDEQLDTIGRTFMGMTLGCARCHDHKFDPFTTQDYYALAGIFKSTKTMENFKVVAVWYERPLAAQAEIEQHQRYEQQRAEKQKALDQFMASANEELLENARSKVGQYLLAGEDLLENQESLRSLKLAVAFDVNHLPAESLLRETENFDRGDVEKTLAGYGEGIGVLLSRGAGFAEYDVSVAEAGPYQLHLRYAAAESRPVNVAVNGQVVTDDAAGGVTGSWNPDGQVWSIEAVVTLQAGKNVLRLERAGVFPHLDKFLLIPWQSPASTNGQPPKTVYQLALQRGLQNHWIKQWAAYLESTRNDPGSPLVAWHAFETARRQALQALQGSSGLIASTFRQFQNAAREDLAQRYHDLFAQAQRAGATHSERGQDHTPVATPDADLDSLRNVLRDPKGPFTLSPQPDSYYPQETLATILHARSELKSLEASAPPPLPTAMGVTEGEVQNVHVHLRGNHLTLGDEVVRRFPPALARNIPAAIDATQSGRLPLAQWLTRADHPLTSRVMVNRIWRWHFGEGLVRTPDNFGATGEPPSHPELLDWLAAEFVHSGWSIKAMHRTILLSATYQMSTTDNPAAQQTDPDNRLWWRSKRRRLEAEAMRDAVLSIAGTLDATTGGTLLKVANHAYVTDTGTSRLTDEYKLPRRSVYLPVIRSAVYDQFSTFDFADPSMPNGDRATTTIAPQALFMLNSQFVAEQSESLARRLLARADLDDAGRVTAAYQLAFGRPPTPEETTAALEFLQRYQRAWSEKNPDHAVLIAWRGFCRVIIGSNEFIYVD